MRGVAQCRLFLCLNRWLTCMNCCRMFTALHRPQSEYDAPAPFAMPSYASVMGQFNHVRDSEDGDACVPRTRVVLNLTIVIVI